MKINEIAPRRLDEANPIITPTVKYVGPYFDKAAAAAAKAFGAGKGAAQAELGGIKASGGQLSDAEKAALGIVPPQRSELPAVFRRRGDPGFDTTSRDADLFNRNLPNYLQDMPPAQIDIKAPAAPKPKADTSAFDKEVRSRHDMNPNMPNKGKPSAEADAYAAEKAAQAERTAAERTAAAEKAAAAERQAAEPAAGAETSAATEPAATGGRQVRPRRPGQGSAPVAPPGYELYPAGHVDNLITNLRPGPGVQDTAKKSSWPWAAGALGTALGYTGGMAGINAMNPDAGLDLVDPTAYVRKGPEKVLSVKPLPPGERIQKVTEPETERSKASSNSSTETPAPAPVSPAVKSKSADEIPDDDPRVQELMRQLEKNGKLDESTAALTRMVYLSRL